MKNFALKKQSKLSLFGTAVILLSFVFASCSNFMEGADLRNKLEREIYIANHEQPVAKVEEPVFVDDGVSKNKTIVISFTQSMNIENFMENLTITDSLGNNLKTHYLAPIWSNNNKLVRIPSNSQNPIDLKGKTTADIYVTISKTFVTTDDIPLASALEYRFRIRDKVTNTIPELHEVKLELPYAYINQEPSDKVIELLDYDYNEITEESIITNNHIGSKFDYYVEGNDPDGETVSANIIIQRITDITGKKVYEDGQPFTKKLDKVNYEGNYFTRDFIDLSGTGYPDGLYKVEISVINSQENKSTRKSIYHLVKDSNFAVPSNLKINFETPSFTKGTVIEGDVEGQTAVFENQSYTVTTIKSFQTRISLGGIPDDIYYISKTTGKIYKNMKDDFSYYFSWAVSMDDFTEDNNNLPCVKVDGFIEKNNLFTANPNDETISFFILPEEYRQFIDSHEDQDVYVRITLVDKVGNKRDTYTIVPMGFDFCGYEVEEGTIDDTKKIKLTFADTQLDLTKFKNLPDKIVYNSYKLFYGEAEEGTNSELIPLTRNVSTEMNQFGRREKDCAVIDNLDPEKDCYVYIQPCFAIMSATNWEGLGQTYGPLYCLKVNYTHSNTQALNKPIIEETEWKSAGVNTGFIKVSVKIQNHQNGTSYIPCYNTYNPDKDYFDDNWYFFPKENENSFSFEVHNPISEGTYSYIKILAINSDGIITSSELQNLNVAGIDNNPPKAAWGLTYHDSQLSFDGHSFSYNNLIRDDENSVINNFYYYYTVYDEAWGDSLDIFTPEQIQNLPHANGTYSYFQDNPTSANNDGNGWSPLIPINGLADGKYMFFIKALDASGNYFITSLGKAHIGTFKNKLRVKYDEDTNKFTSTLKINDNEYFDRNMINVQYFNQGDSTWTNFYEMQNELQKCILNKNTKELENTTNPNIIRKERIQAWEWVKNPDTGEYVYVPDVCSTSDVVKPLAKGTFYRLTIQSFNQNEYNPETGKGVNRKYALPYSEDFSTHNIVYEVDGETEYDLCTEETVSNTVYYYIPASKTELNEFKKSFFKNTAGLKTNRPALVHVISSLTNLGSDIDEWERRGKLIATHYYNGLQENTGFNDSVAADDMYNSGEKGMRYYVIIVHYANNQTDISNVYEVSNSN